MVVYRTGGSVFRENMQIGQSLVSGLGDCFQDMYASKTKIKKHRHYDKVDGLTLKEKTGLFKRNKLLATLTAKWTGSEKIELYLHDSRLDFAPDYVNAFTQTNNLSSERIHIILDY